MDYEINLQERQAQPVVAIRDKVARSEMEQALATLLPRVGRYLEQQGVRPAGHPYVRYHSSQIVDRVDYDVEVGYPVAQSVAEADNIVAGELPGGQALVTRHSGAYGGVVAAYEALQEWIENSDYEAAAAPWELYLVDPAAMEAGDDWEIELVWPVSQPA